MLTIYLVAATLMFVIALYTTYNPLVIELHGESGELEDLFMGVFLWIMVGLVAGLVVPITLLTIGTYLVIKRVRKL